jgi:hypothetical protein
LAIYCDCFNFYNCSNFYFINTFTSIQLIEASHIDKEKWDKKVADAHFNNITLYSWFLDAVADHWCGLVNDETYSSIFPVTYTSKLGVKQVYQAFFTRQYEVIGNSFTLNDAITFLKPEFKKISFRSSQNLTLNARKTVRKHQLLHTNAIQYKSNAKRMVKKAQKQYTYRFTNQVDDIVAIIGQTLSKQIHAFTPKTLNKLKTLAKVSLQKQKGDAIGIYENDCLIGGGFFLKDKATVTYLIASTSIEHKKNGAVYGLIDFALSHYQTQYKIFDFGGSNIDSIADFYKKFGAEDKTYFEYTINQLPIWFKALQNIKLSISKKPW